MSTNIHKILVDLIARKMRHMGYVVVALEGSYLKYPSDKQISIPWKLKRHRPDVIGINLKSNRVCIGEAKTADDLFSKRTAAQITDFNSIICKSGEKPELIIGIPYNSKNVLFQLLRKLDIPSKDVTILILPEELVENGENLI